MPKELREEFEQQKAEETLTSEAGELFDEVVIDEVTEVLPPPFSMPEPRDTSDRSYNPADPAESDYSDSDPESDDPRMLTVWEGIAKFFYFVFNPYLIPAYATLLLFELSVVGLTAPGAALIYTLTVLGITCVVPLIVLFFLTRLGAVKDFSLKESGERTVPYVVSLLTLGAAVGLFLARSAPAWLWTVFAGGCVTILVNLFVNYKIRVSNHASAVAALLAAFVVLQMSGMAVHPLGWWVIGTVMILGIVGTAAMIIGRHSLFEVVVGYATGFLPVILMSLIK